MGGGNGAVLQLSRSAQWHIGLNKQVVVMQPLMALLILASCRVNVCRCGPGEIPKFDIRIYL